MRITKYTRKLSFCCYVALNVQPVGEQNRYGLVWAVVINPSGLPINDESRNDAHIASTGVRLYQRTPKVATQKETKQESSHRNVG